MNVKYPLSTVFHKRSSQPRTAALIGFAFMMLLITVLAACGPQGTGEAAGRTKAATDGAALFESLECIHCHDMDGSGQGPSLAGLYGQTIRQENGQTVTVDDQYIRTSILNPDAHTRAGYRPIMPSYKGRISEEELSRLVEYVRSLNGGN